MKLQFGWVMAGLLVFNSAALVADDNSDKLDAILNEIKRLNERVSQLEKQVGRLTAELRAAQRLQPTETGIPKPAKKPEAAIEPMQILRRIHDAKSTIQLQQQAPGELLKNIYERELELRKRPFPPEVIPN